MKTFACEVCQNDLYFENTACLRCQSAVGFDPQTKTMVTLRRSGTSDAFVRAVSGAQEFKYCGNSVHGVCNWVTPSPASEDLCLACELNRTIPNLEEQGSLEAWRLLEFAKKRLVYSLLSLGLPLRIDGREDRQLAFDFVRKAVTGHKDGVITIDIKEADPVERERQRLRFEEPYRTLLGHLRHESGHFYWLLLVQDANRLQEFRRLFGDERQDYAEALARHYQEGPIEGWQSSHVSAYASVHPWEDWAETWAQYLHIVDAVDTASAVGMEARGKSSAPFTWRFKPSHAYRRSTFEALMQRWLPLALGLNNLSRSMGHPDFYPFIIPAGAYDKLNFVHKTIQTPRKRSLGARAVANG